MRASSLTLTLALCVGSVLVACGPAEPPSTPLATASATATPPPVVQPAVEPTASATVAATSEPVPAAPETPPVAVEVVDTSGNGPLSKAVALINAGDYAKARATINPELHDLKMSNLTGWLAANTLLGRLCHALGDETCAGKHYGIVLEAWKDPARVAKWSDNIGGTDKEKAERLQRDLYGIGEATFHEADHKRVAAEKERFPEYKGKGDKESVDKHLGTKVAAWVKKRRERMAEAEKAYVAVVQIQPMPPPKWVVASASSVGAMWGKLVAELRAAPIPKDWQGTGTIPGTKLTREDVRASYHAALDDASAPHQATARAAFQKCQDMALKFGIKDDYAKACDAWLAKNPAPAAHP